MSAPHLDDGARAFGKRYAQQLVEAADRFVADELARDPGAIRRLEDRFVELAEQYGAVICKTVNPEDAPRIRLHLLELSAEILESAYRSKVGIKVGAHV